MDVTTPWRKIAAAAYSGPQDCRIFGTIEADITDTIDYIHRQRRSGNKVTPLHFVAAALARTISEDIPQINCFLRRGRFIRREHVDVFITVALQRGEDLTGIIIPNGEGLSASSMAKFLREEVKKKRRGEDSGFVGSKNTLAKIPWPFRRALFLLIKWWVYGMGFQLPFFHIPRDPFGSVILSDIGSHGLATGNAALFPMGRVPVVITMGKMTKKPLVKKNKVVIRTIVPLTATLDHRIVDGAQAGSLARGIARRLRHPEQLDTTVASES